MTVFAEKQYTHRTEHDKRKWGEGPWVSEPDKIQWVDEKTGLDCLIHRNGSGALCGYVGVQEGHPAFNKHYDQVDVDVHGGPTYSEFCQPSTDEAHGICHVPYDGRPEHVWWIGFDCAHSGDLRPGLNKFNEKFYRDHPKFAHLHDRDKYRDVAYVKAECARLAAQLSAMEFTNE
jgi:hypothetical protein